MKKGCFIKLIVAITIIVAVALYIFEKHFDDLIIKPGRKIMKEIALESIDEKLAPIKDTPEKDSLKALIARYVEYRISNFDFSNQEDSTGDIKIGFDFSDEGRSAVEAEIKLISDSLSYFIKDKVIDKNELLKIREILKENNNE